MIAGLKNIETAANEAARAVGITHLKKEQRDAITAFARGRDVFVSLPTGYGKSVCYGCLPGLFSRLRSSDGSSSSSFPIAVIVSPLISIMKDQTREFSGRGLSSIYVTSSISREEELSVLQGRFSMVYISPELLLCCDKYREMLRSDIYKERMIAFVVDEAHCVKKWYVQVGVCKESQKSCQCPLVFTIHSALIFFMQG